MSPSISQILADHLSEGQTLQNGFLFHQTFQNPELLRLLLIDVLSLPVEQVRYCAILNEQEYVQEKSALVQAEITVDSRKYFVLLELLTEPVENLAMRARFFQQSVDRLYYCSGGTDNLPADIYVLFLCTFEPFPEAKNHGFAKDTVVSTFQGTDIPAPSNYQLSLLNTHYRPDMEHANVSADVIELLDYIRTGDDDMPVRGELLQLAREGLMGARAAAMDHRG